jgi:carboxypeptidase C (cathepsin A)
MFKRALVVVASLIVIAFSQVLRGQAVRSTQAPPSQAKAQVSLKAKTDEPASDKPKMASDEEPVVTHHQMSVNGKELKYTATAGLMPIKDAKGEVEARIFFIAYILDYAGPTASRPLMFSFNGGPGSASVWLHLGALGPHRVAMPEEPTIPAPPFHLVENESTWLDNADLVFIDPVGTGFSRAAKPELNSKFHSLRGDIDSVGEFIRMYLTRYDRWDSPLYLIGESYGTTRAVGLAGHLIDLGIAFNGLILVSCAVDFHTFTFGDGNEQPFLSYLPSYAACAWYHKRLPADLQREDLATVVAEVERWTDREYASILARGDRLNTDERREAAARLARYSGLSPADVEANRLRIDMAHSCTGLLKNQRRSIGRFDARYQGIETAVSPNRPTFDPSLAAVRAPYTSTFNHYIRRTLRYKSDLPYYILGEGVGRWDWQRQMGYPATTDDLRDAMTKNPHLKVLIASGYYDLARPYRAIEHTLAGMGLDPALRRNITIEKYEAGHMMYLHSPSLHKLKRDGEALVRRGKSSH